MKEIKYIFISVVTIIILAVMSGCGKTTINLNDYVSVEFYGYNHDGSASLDFDYDQLFEDYEKVFGRESFSVLSMMDDAFDAKLDKEENLSNGDSIKLIWNVKPERLEKEYNVKIKYSDFKVTVKDLTEAVAYNPFEDVSFIFEGYNEYGVPVCEYRGSWGRVVLTCSKNSNLKNGDKVTFKVDEEYSSLPSGVYFSKKEQDATVSGLKELVVYNPFEYLTVTIGGYNEHIDVAYEYTGAVSGINFEVANAEKAKNGDKIKVYVTSAIDEKNITDIFLVQGYKIEKTTNEYLVEGLTDVTSFNPFDNIEVTFEGVSKEATVKIKNNNELYGLSFQADKPKNIANGDTIIISAVAYDGTDVDNFCLKEGFYPTEVTKSFKVEGLNFYAEKLTDISEEEYQKMVEQAADFKAHYCVSKKYKGGWFLSAKEGTNPKFYNKLYIVYEVIQKTSAHAEEQVRYYPYHFYGIVVDGEGKVISIKEAEEYFNGWGEYDYEHAYNDYILGDLDNYTFIEKDFQ